MGGRYDALVESYKPKTRRFSRAEYDAAHYTAIRKTAKALVLNLVDRVLEVYREPVPDPAAPFEWRYARREVFDASRLLP